MSIVSPVLTINRVWWRNRGIYWDPMESCQQTILSYLIKMKKKKSKLQDDLV